MCIRDSDLPTLMGYDSDHAASEGEVGKCGVAIDSLEDMEILFGGIDLEKTTVSMTINSPASVLWAMYLVVAEKQGADWNKISGTIQNDILKEYICLLYTSAFIHCAARSRPTVELTAS